MKTIMFMFVIVFLALTFQVMAEDKVLINRETGEVQVIKSTSWKTLDSFEKEAYENPGQKVFIYELNIIKENFFYARLQKVANEAVIFQDGKFEKISEYAEITGEPQFLWHVPIIFLSILLMLLSNFGKVKGKNVFVAPLAACATVVYAVVVVASSALLAAAAVVFAIVSCASAVFTFAFAVDIAVNNTNVEFGSKILYWSFSTIFYGTALIAVFI